MQIIKKIFCLFILLSITSTCFAADLMQVYQQALKSDPTFQAAQSQYLADTQAYPQARSLVLPLLVFSGAYNYTDSDIKSSPVSGTAISDAFEGKNNFNSQNYTLTLTQPIFNFGSFAQIHLAKAQVKEAAATYQAAAQDLMIRVADAYFGVLEAQDNLRFIEADKRATQRQLDQAEQRYNVGLSAITAVYDAQATYDSIVAEEIAAKNDVVNKREDLREITGVYYKKLSRLKTLPLLRPNPDNVEKWVMQAKEKNYSFMAQRFAVQAAKENIKVNFSGHLPILNAVGTYNRVRASSNDIGAPSDSDVYEGSLQLDFPIFQGGLVLSQTKQAQYDYQTAISDMINVERQVTVGARQSFNNVIDGISKIKADKQTIKSRASSLESTEAALNVGTRTMVDLLLAQRELFQSQSTLAIDQYSYILNTLQLKEFAGTLNVNDLKAINKLLTPTPLPKDDIATKRPEPSVTAETVAKSTPKATTATAEFWAIQLVGTHEKDSFINFIKSYNLADKTEYRVIHVSGRDWYELLYGKYKTEDEALETMKNLPQNLEELHPWVKRITTGEKTEPSTNLLKQSKQTSSTSSSKTKSKTTSKQTTTSATKPATSNSSSNNSDVELPAMPKTK